MSVSVSVGLANMETEAQNTPEATPQAESTPIKPVKKQHGGKRAGAGRKPDLVKRMIGSLKPATARDILATVDVEKVVSDIFAKGSLTLKQRTLADLWDRAYGRPAQNVALSGGLVHAHTDWRPLSSLTDAEVALLDSITKKLLPAPATDATQNGPGFQVESSTAIEAEVVDSEAIEA